VSATQVYYSSFDSVFLKLRATLRLRIERRIDEIGSRLATFPHHRLKGSNRFRVRVGDYRIIYAFDLDENKIPQPLSFRRLSLSDLKKASSRAEVFEFLATVSAGG